MKDYSQYHYTELYGMLNHLNPFKYDKKKDEIRMEIELRKERGEIPELMVPIIDWSSFTFWKKKTNDEHIIYTEHATI